MSEHPEQRSGECTCGRALTPNELQPRDPWCPQHGGRISERLVDPDGRFQRALDVGLRYKAERDDAQRRLREMTAARDHCKRQTDDVSERLIAFKSELPALLGEFLTWIDDQEGAPTPDRAEAAEWLAVEFLKDRSS